MAKSRRQGQRQARSGSERQRSETVVETVGRGGLFAAVAVAALSMLLFWLSLNALRVFIFTSVDSFWLIQTGLDILSSLRLPEGDPFSFTHYGQSWVLYQWLFEVACGLVFRLGGIQLLQAATMVLATVLFGVLALRDMTRHGIGFFTAWWVCGSAFCASLTFITLRPQLVSLILVYLVKRLADSHWDRPGWRILWLAPIFAVWANCHVIFPIGLAMVAVYFAAAVWDWLKERRSASAETAWQRLRLGGVALVLSVGATLLNPYGWDIYSYGLTVSSQGFWTEHIGEVTAPSFDSPVGFLILAYILLSIASFVVATGRPTLPEALVYLGLLGAGLTSYKLLPVFIAASLHGTALRLGPALADVALGVRPAFIRAVSTRLSGWALSPWWPLSMLAVALAFGLSRPVLFPPWVPMAAADYLAAHMPSGHVFCSAKTGSYLIYRFQGKLPVFIDTRFDMYGERFAQLYFAVNRTGAAWRQVFERYGITCAFVDPGSGIAAALGQAPDWKEVYRDRGSVIFVSGGRGGGSDRPGLNRP